VVLLLSAGPGDPAAPALAWSTPFSWGSGPSNTVVGAGQPGASSDGGLTLNLPQQVARAWRCWRIVLRALLLALPAGLLAAHWLAGLNWRWRRCSARSCWAPAHGGHPLVKQMRLRRPRRGWLKARPGTRTIPAAVWRSAAWSWYSVVWALGSQTRNRLVIRLGGGCCRSGLLSGLCSPSCCAACRWIPKCLRPCKLTWHPPF